MRGAGYKVAGLFFIERWLATVMMDSWDHLRFMGEAKRRKEQGLPPRPKKEEKKADTPNIFARYQILPYILVGGFIIFLIYDVIKYYSAG